MKSILLLVCFFVAIAVGQQVYYPEYYSSEVDNEPYGAFSTFNYAYYQEYVAGNENDDDEGLFPDDDDEGADDDDGVNGNDDDYFFGDDDLQRIDDDEQHDAADDDFEGDRPVQYDAGSSSIMKPVIALFMIGFIATLF